MAERSFKNEVQKLRAKEGELFKGEGILAITKALLENGVGYIGGYQGAPISHLMDVLADAQDILDELGIHFEVNASEAGAAAMLSASISYPIRGAITFKSTVGTNVASDALANLSSAGVKGGALIILGEDYGEGSSILQERSHAFAMKSQIWLLDPRPNLQSMTAAVRTGFELSEASNTPVMLDLRIRACHVNGQFVAKDNIPPKYTLEEAQDNPSRIPDRIVLPPFLFKHEQEKVVDRWPAAIDFIQKNEVNEFFGPEAHDVGVVVQGGLYNSLIRAFDLLGLTNSEGFPELPVYVLNVTYPLVDTEFLKFCDGKSKILIVEEGQPNFIEQYLSTVLYKHRSKVELSGKECLPMAGEYTTSILKEGLSKFLDPESKNRIEIYDATDRHLQELVPSRPAGFCTGCPERPVFSALKLVEQELGPIHIAGDIGCHLFSSLPPFNLGSSTMGYGLGIASNSAFSKRGHRRSLSIIGDGGLWHNGLTSGIGNAVFNKYDGIILIVDNFYSAATGGQDVPSSRANNASKVTQNSIEAAVRGMGIKWVRHIERTYDVDQMKQTLLEAFSSDYDGPKVIIGSSECMLNKQRREKPLKSKAEKLGERVVHPKFGIDDEICTGDHACMRLSGCPSLTLKQSKDPLKEDPVAFIDESCVGCGNCGEVATSAVLCPSFYQVDEVRNPSLTERLRSRISKSIINYLQSRRKTLDLG